MLANVSFGQAGGPSSKRKASFFNPERAPDGSVRAMLWRVKGSSSFSFLGGRSNRASRADSTVWE